VASLAPATLNDLDGKPHPALSLDIAPAPKDIIWTEEAGPYAKYYDEKLREKWGS